MDIENITSLADLKQLKGVKMGSVNVRSVFKNLEEIELLLKLSELDILLLQETFLNQAVSDHLIEIDNYILHRWDRTANSGKMSGGGLCAYIHKCLNVKMLSDWCVCSSDIEKQWLKLDFNVHTTYNVQRT